MDKENTNISGNKSSIDYIKYVPVIYPILVFLGYLNYDIYYQKFNINIFNYLTINELLFSFISLAYPIIFFIIAMHSWLIYKNLTTEHYSETVKEEENSYIHIKQTTLDPSFFLNKFKNAKTNISDSSYFKVFINSILGILFFLIYSIVSLIPVVILMIGFYLVATPFISRLRSNDFYEFEYFKDSEFVMIFTALWLIIFILYLLIRIIAKEMTIKSFRKILIVTSCCLVIATLTRYQNIRAFNFENKKSVDKIQFSYESKNIESNEDIRLLRMTAEYLFLRDIKVKTNYIYKLSDIKNLQITTLKNEDE